MDVRGGLVGLTGSYWQQRAAVALQEWMGLNMLGAKACASKLPAHKYSECVPEALVWT